MKSVRFYLACIKVQGALVVTILGALVSHFKVLRPIFFFFFFFFFCDGQGTVRQANLYVDRSGSELFGCFPQVSQLQDALQSMSSIILQGSLPGSTPATPRSTASSNLLTPGSTGKGR